ncbi:MAG: PAS domain S-box protein [Deltaproteobacteria bacterium]|nr:PAS domain S-box protein [Deltaproteobacteria bacterium]MBW1910287.1 PAS domain S-box protein [Deltaproteobacteria bacterium]MBW2034958.1 PAS domain S-box protein [Deltaproteobacteria bacterium]MBW2115271.1 PAS domain S-box protein [Deltaproteobacteria bacterium]MBW2358120.1 PAS domain S-box protein [Deltaproteobacteria bacterium]
MDGYKFPGIRRNIFIIVCLAAVLFLAGGAILGLWSAREMREQVVGQFNEEQLVIARHVSSLIERELNLLRKEVLLLSNEKPLASCDPEVQYESIQKSLSRVLESGVWEIQIVDLKNHKTYVHTPYKHWFLKEPPDERIYNLPVVKSSDNKNVWISQPQIRSSGIRLMLAVSLAGDSPRLLLFNVNISWLLTPFLKNIRSGKTGYAWLMDENGIFLYHPDACFIGKSAFKVREEKYPYITYGKINFIQKEEMLKGKVGTGWYFSCWNRGITGKIKKLIAYCPVIVSDNPPQKWSVAVVAPISEIEGAIRKGYLRQFLLQGLVILAIVLGTSAILFFEMRWSRVLEKRVNRRTEDLKKSEEKYRSLVESAEDFIFTVDSDGNFQSMNSFTANFFGGRAEEFLGKGLSSLFPEKVAEKQLELVGLVYKLGKSVRDEFELEVGEHEIWISANFMPLKNEEGGVSAVLCIARDITESKNLERQLINTEKLASLGTLAAGVAHEINNPLGVMLGFCDLLLRKTEKGTQEFEDLKTIERQGLHCKQVVENLLSFARLEEGDSEYSDLNHCLGEIIQVVKHTLEMNDIELVLELAENISPVRGDSRQLQQVFLNLTNNALAAMAGGGTLSIRTFPERRTRKAVVQFQDDGIGIRQEDIDHIFEPFFTTKPEGEGTGLGLFVSYGIIAKYGGTIDCVSHIADFPGKPGGTTFTVKLLTKKQVE